MWFFPDGIPWFECNTWEELAAKLDELLAKALKGDKAAWEAYWKLPKSQEEFDAELQRRAELARRFGTIDDVEDSDNEDNNEVHDNEYDVVNEYEVMNYHNRMELANINSRNEENIARIKFLTQHKLLEVRCIEAAHRRREMETYDERRRRILRRIADIEGELRRIQQGNHPPRCQGA